MEFAFARRTLTALAAGFWILTFVASFAGPSAGQGEAAKPAAARPDAPSPEAFDFLPGGTYEPNITVPARQLGYALGTRFTEHHRLIEIVRLYAQNNDRAVLEKYGETKERRPLYLAYVSSPENLKALKQVRVDLHTLIESRTLDKKNLDDILDRLPAIVWLSFNVHGNEPSPSEAAIGLMYQLVAGTDARTEAIRKNTIVILDPCVNPDGRERYVRWFNGIVGAEPDANPASWEHDEPWPGGRVNHYYFDLNRDWAFLTQVESRARIAAYLVTPPQVHVDFHEMAASSSYFFFPPEFPVNTNLPLDVVEWAKIFGTANASAFDKFGWAYYTRENFDLFYPGYGDSWPTFQGAVGMTYEQAGHSMAGLTLRRDDEQVLTLRDRAWHHFTAAFTTCETAASRRRELVTRFREWHRTAMEEGETGAIREYAMVEGNDPARAAALASLLTAQGIQVFRAGDAFVAGPLRDFDGKEFEREAFPAGTYLIPLTQPRKRLANALLEPAPQMKDLYFYDVSAWSLPRAFGVKAYQLSEAARVKRAVFDGSTSKVKPIEGEPKSVYAYLLDWRQGNAPRFIAGMLAEGTRVSYATKEFQMGGKTWGRGTAVIPVLNNGENLTERVRVRAEDAGVTLVAVSTGRSDEGIDLGSDQVRPLKARRVALVVGPQVASSSFGAVRYILERSYRIPFSILPLDNLSRARLGDFGTIVFPDGRDFESIISKETVVKLRDWAASGGTIVAMGGSAFWACAERSGLTRIRASKPAASVDKKETGSQPDSGPRRYVPADLRAATERRTGNPGAILRLDIEPASSVMFGCGDGPLYVLATNEQAFDPESGSVAAVFTNDPKAAGFVGAEASRSLAGQAFAISERIGKGRAVLFSEDPNFRLVWQGLAKAFLNALLLP